MKILYDAEEVRGFCRVWLAQHPSGPDDNSYSRRLRAVMTRFSAYTGPDIAAFSKDPLAEWLYDQVEGYTG